MKQRLADYVADFLAAHGVTDVFSVVGGGAMHLNDALGHHPALHVTYNHHEQASAIAAEAYARIDNKIAALCVTTGPGGTNALTGVVGGWLDSIPMFVISGQVRYDTTARYAAQFTDGLPLRAVGDQEYDITKSVAPMTKYATMLEDPNQIRYVLEKPGTWQPPAAPARCGSISRSTIRAATLKPTACPAMTRRRTMPGCRPRWTMPPCRWCWKNPPRQAPGVPRRVRHPAFRRVRSVPRCGGKAEHPYCDLLERRGPDRGRKPALLRSCRQYGRPPWQLGHPERRPDSGCGHPHFHPPGGL